MIRCTGCGPQKTSAFHKAHYNKRGYQYRCKKCQLSINRDTHRRRAERRKLALKSNRPIIAIGDVHFPWHSEAWLAWMLEVIKERQPGLVVQLGDLFDQFAFSKYPRSHNVMLPDEEITEARWLAEDMWKEIHKAVPDADCVQLKGNHDDRIARRITEHLPEIEGLLTPTINALYHFGGVKTVNESREEFEARGVLFHHGHRKFGAHMQYNNQSTVNGHLHKGGVVYTQTKEGLIWELNAGCGIDTSAPVFTYGAQKRLHGVTLGLGEIDQYGPRFIPMQERR